MRIIYFDLESTGLNTQTDRIIQIALVGSDGFEFQTLVDPGMSIPSDVQALTGITDAMVAEAPRFQDIAHQVEAMVRESVLVGFGCHKFDVPLLAEEFERAALAFEWPTVIDAGELFKILEPRTLAAAVRHYCKHDLIGAHSAMVDAMAVRDVFEVQARHDKLAGMSLGDIEAFSRHGIQVADPAGKLARRDGVLVFNTLRNRGVPVLDDIGYAEWMLRTDFPLATKAVLRRELHEGIDREQRAVAAMASEDRPPF